MKEKKIKTRFAPSPTGFMHLGNVRSALYPWAFAKANDGKFILRIEDTDVDRSTLEAVDVIIDSLKWMGLEHDEGPHFQMKRINRYKEVLDSLMSEGLVYPCYMSQVDLDDMRAKKLENKEKPKYDETWRPEVGKVLPEVPVGVNPVLRFKNPKNGIVSWEDKVKGVVQVSNDELDDFVVARASEDGSVGVPTYNFCVVVDDIDMEITHIIRGDDHVNNTPKQINLYKALGVAPPVYAHLPTVLNELGQKLSKRDGAKSIMQFKDEGYLPDALVNYLARLGWANKNEEFFTREQFLSWFSLDGLGKAAAQFDEKKLRWLNAQHIKAMPDADLASAVIPFMTENMLSVERMEKICAAFKSRCTTLVDIAKWATIVSRKIEFVVEEPSEKIKSALIRLKAGLELCDWNAKDIGEVIKEALGEGLKMPELAPVLRTMLMGTTDAPAINVVISLFERVDVLEKMVVLTNEKEVKCIANKFRM